jgi:hypothetical protein
MPQAPSTAGCRGRISGPPLLQNPEVGSGTAHHVPGDDAARLRSSVGRHKWLEIRRPDGSLKRERRLQTPMELLNGDDLKPNGAVASFLV